MEDTFEKFSSMTSCDNVSHDFVFFLLKKTLNIAHNQIYLQNVLDNAPGILYGLTPFSGNHKITKKVIWNHLICCLGILAFWPKILGGR